MSRFCIFVTLFGIDNASGKTFHNFNLHTLNLEIKKKLTFKRNYC